MVSVCHEIVVFTQPPSYTYWGGCGSVVSGNREVVSFIQKPDRYGGRVWQSGYLAVVSSCNSYTHNSTRAQRESTGENAHVKCNLLLKSSQQHLAESESGGRGVDTSRSGCRVIVSIVCMRWSACDRCGLRGRVPFD